MVGVEEDLDSNSTASLVQSSHLTTPLGNDALPPSQASFINEVKSLLLNVQAQISDLQSKSEGTSSPKAIPPQPSGLSQGSGNLPVDSNPWRPCAIFCLIENGTKLWTPHGTLVVADLEFRPSLSAFPNCDFRFKLDEHWQGTQIASEVIVLPENEAAKRLANVARKCGFQALGVASFGSRTAILEGPSDAPYPFAGKALKKALESLHEGFSSPPLLEECKPFGVIVPGASEPFSEWKDVAQIFVSKRLPAEVASSQLKEAFPRLPAQLVTDEYAARRALARSLSLQMAIESSMEAKMSEEMFPVLAKMHLHSLVADLVTFFKARKACRDFIFRNAKITHETRELAESNMFCKLLFPEDKVEEVLKRAAKDNRSLLSKWGMLSQKRHLPAHTSAQPTSFPAPYSPATKRRRTKRTARTRPQVAPSPSSQFSSSASPVVHYRHNEAATGSFHAQPSGTFHGPQPSGPFLVPHPSGTFHGPQPSGSRTGRGRRSRRSQSFRGGDFMRKQ